MVINLSSHPGSSLVLSREIKSVSFFFFFFSVLLDVLTLTFIDS